MSTTEQERDRPFSGWGHIGRAAERFGRRVARDAGRFAERMEEHAGDFAGDISRDWRRAERTFRRGRGHVSQNDVRRIIEDVRSFTANVLDGVDELIESVFGSEARSSETSWSRMVSSRDAACAGCDRPILAGEEAFARRGENGVELRCLTCGPPSPA